MKGVRKNMKITNMSSFLLMAIVSISALTLGIEMIKDSLNKSEALECIKWERQSQVYSGFYLTVWQDEQCRAHNIIINTKVI